MSRAELISLMAAVIYSGGKMPTRGSPMQEDALDIAVFLANEAEKRCQREAPQMQEFEQEP